MLLRTITMATQCQPSVLPSQTHKKFLGGSAYPRIHSDLRLTPLYKVKERKTKTYAKEALNTQLVALADQMHEYIAINHFYYDAVEALFNEDEAAEGINDHSRYGLKLITHWLRDKDSALLEQIKQLTAQVASMDNNEFNTD